MSPSAAPTAGRPNTSASRPAGWPIRRRLRLAPARSRRRPAEQFAFGGQASATPASRRLDQRARCGARTGRSRRAWPARSNPAADPAGEVRKRFSADGSHLRLRSRQEIRDAGNEGSVSIYERDLGSRLDPGRLDDPERLDDDRQRHRRARRLRRRRPGPDRETGRRRRAPATSSTTSTCTSAAARTRFRSSTSASGVIFNGMTDDGVEGLLHDARPAGRRHGHERRPLRRRRRLASRRPITRLSTGHRRHRQHRRLRTGQRTGTSSRRARLQRRRRSPAAAGSPAATAPSTSSAPSCSTAPATAPRTRPTSTSSSRASRRTSSATIDSSLVKPGQQPPEPSGRERQLRRAA